MIKRLLLTASAGIGLIVGGATAKAQALTADEDVVVGAQPQPGQPATIERRQVFVHNVGGPGAPVEFMSAEFGVGGKTVKGAPYAADATTETTQVLADGNRIKHKTASFIARDGDGRTRRDFTLPVVGQMNRGDAPKISSIFDPVTNVSYTLDHNQKVARKLAGMGMAVRIESRGSEAPVSGDVLMHKPAARLRLREADATAKTESLGKRTIEGVLAEGTRTTRVIPAGQIGNDRPIEVVSEQWYSPELQVLILSRHSDPRVGETVYSLTNVRRGEPLRSLFEVPPDYTIKEEPAPPLRHLPNP